MPPGLMRPMSPGFISQFSMCFLAWPDLPGAVQRSSHSPWPVAAVPVGRKTPVGAAAWYPGLRGVSGSEWCCGLCCHSTSRVNGITNGVVTGVVNGVVTGEVNGVIDEVFDGVLNGLATGVDDGIVNGVLDGVFNGAVNGVFNGIFDV